ncbi:hypothetical protein XA68_16419 [Ophiocordyceps unilateralis]|uniref:Uncharacterized protein n=1 Tax=Ophiocordyceps unilateralis TaxID=268505 RepID=A0A2A9P6L0_OPHUN|nr:hypothetical protein XA68_16419 [Ophiocordyceps unilateralis]
MPESISSTSSGVSSSSASTSSSSSATSSSPTSPTTSSHTHFNLGENKAIRFQIRAGNQRWTCTLQDRASYERVKAVRTNSIDSTASTNTASSANSGAPH